LLDGGISLAVAERAIAFDSYGNVHIVYAQISDNEAGCWEVYYVTNTGGNWSWTNISRMNLTNYWLSQPVLAVDSNNVIHVAWSGGYVMVDADIFYTNNSGGSWHTPVNITQTGSEYEFTPTITTDSANNVHIAYLYAPAIMSSTVSLNYINFTVTSGWGPKINITDPIGPFNSITSKKSIGADSHNNIYVAFTAYNSTPANSELYLVNNSNGDWGTPVNISQNQATTPYVDYDPSMYIDNLDNIHLLWQIQNNSNYGIEYKVYSQAAWSTSQYVNATTEKLYYHSICADVNNKAHIVISQYDATASKFDLYYANNTQDTFNTPHNITGTSAAEEKNPHIVVDNQGYAHIVYSRAASPNTLYYMRSTNPVAIIPNNLPLIIGISVGVIAVIAVTTAWFYTRAKRQ